VANGAHALANTERGGRVVVVGAGAVVVALGSVEVGDGDRAAERTPPLASLHATASVSRTTKTVRARAMVDPRYPVGSEG
jgi:hypothetical protein